MIDLHLHLDGSLNGRRGITIYRRRSNPYKDDG